MKINSALAVLALFTLSFCAQEELDLRSPADPGAAANTERTSDAGSKKQGQNTTPAPDSTTPAPDNTTPVQDNTTPAPDNTAQQPDNSGGDANLCLTSYQSSDAKKTVDSACIFCHAENAPNRNNFALDSGADEANIDSIMNGADGFAALATFLSSSPEHGAFAGQAPKFDALGADCQ